MSRSFVDTNIPMYAGGTAHPLREPAQRVVLAIASGRLDAVTDAEVFQEILYRYLRLGERDKGFRIFDQFFQIMRGRILTVEPEDVQLARHLAERYPALSPRDLVHCAVMQRNGVDAIISADTDFDAVGEFRRIDPATFVGE